MKLRASELKPCHCVSPIFLNGVAEGSAGGSQFSLFGLVLLFSKFRLGFVRSCNRGNTHGAISRLRQGWRYNDRTYFCRPTLVALQIQRGGSIPRSMST